MTLICPVNTGLDHVADDVVALILRKGSTRETPTATYKELLTFRAAKAVELGLSSLATAALIAWGRLQGEIDIFCNLRRLALSTERALQHGATDR
ncbi:hypothetical protein [Bradyrhizobium cenepequi]